MSSDYVTCDECGLEYDLFTRHSTAACEAHKASVMSEEHEDIVQNLRERIEALEERLDRLEHK